MDSKTFGSFKEAAQYAAECAKLRRVSISLKQFGAQWQVVLPKTLAKEADRSDGHTHSKPEEPDTSPQHLDNHYRFSVQRRSHRSYEFAENLQLEKEKVVNDVTEYFPTANIEARIELAASTNDFSTYGRNYFIVVSFSDLTMSTEEFNDTLREFCRVLHH